MPRRNHFKHRKQENCTAKKGHQRQRGGGSDNPNTLQFMYATSSIRTQKTIGRVRRGSVWGSKQAEDLEKQDDDAPLAKRPRRK